MSPCILVGEEAMSCRFLFLLDFGEWHRDRNRLFFFSDEQKKTVCPPKKWNMNGIVMSLSLLCPRIPGGELPSPMRKRVSCYAHVREWTILIMNFSLRATINP